MEDQEVKDTTSNETSQENTGGETVNNAAQETQTEKSKEYTASDNNEEKFSQQQYLDNAKALGYSAIAVKGAFFNCEKQELTKSEFAQLMKDFLGKKVK